MTTRPIHGEPHLGNFLMTDAGLHLIDFETTCRGPIEWDLASLPSDVISRFGDVDDKLLQVLRTLNSVRVATWCFNSPDTSMIEHGAYHLAAIRAAPPTR